MTINAPKPTVLKQPDKKAIICDEESKWNE